MPTGDPNIPETVYHAKVIADKIMENCEAAVMAECDPDDEDQDSEDSKYDEVIFCGVKMEKDFESNTPKSKENKPSLPDLQVLCTNSRSSRKESAERKQAYFDHFKELLMEEHWYKREQEVICNDRDKKEHRKEREKESHHYGQVTQHMDKDSERNEKI